MGLGREGAMILMTWSRSGDLGRTQSSPKIILLRDLQFPTHSFVSSVRSSAFHGPPAPTCPPLLITNTPPLTRRPEPETGVSKAEAGREQSLVL